MLDYKTQGQDEIKEALKWLKDQVYMESRIFRDSKLRMWRRNESFWLNIQRALYIESTKGFISPEDFTNIPLPEGVEVEDYNRVINIYRAHGEAFIAALSASLPSPVYTPDDAENPDDISTAKAYRKLSELLSIRNEAPTKFIKILYHLYNHGVAFTYSIYHRDKRFGSIKSPIVEYKQVEKDINACPDCGVEMGEMQAPGNAMQGMMNEAPEGMSSCLQCGYQGPGVPSKTSEEIPYISSYEETPKGNTTIEVFGPLHVTVPEYVRTLEFAGFLRLDTDLDEGLVKELYPGIELRGSGSYSQDKYYRIPPNQPVTDQAQIFNTARVWFRPWMFNRLGDENVAQTLKEMFPKGVYCVFVNEEFAEAYEEALDDVWGSTEFPTSERIHNEPLGNALVPIQEMTNDLVALTMDTIEAGVPVNFFDARAIDRDAFKNNGANPGDFIPANPRPGQSLDSSFTSVKPAMLSREVEPFQQSLKEFAQFVLGTFPSVYGGTQEGGSKTLGELRDSKAQALQRLSIPWIAGSMCWVKTLKRSCTLLINNLLEGEDEKLVKRIGNSFINVWIRSVELKGRIGDVSVESSEQIPMTWNQKRAFILDMVNQGNQMMMSWLTHPENISFLAEVIGLTELYVPGDDDRDKQLKEIFQLISSEPTPAPPGPDGNPQNAPSVPIDPQIDNHPIHIEVIKAFLNSEVGIELKNSNPAGYQNVLAHFNAHDQFMKSMAPPPMPQNGPQK